MWKRSIVVLGLVLAFGACMKEDDAYNSAAQAESDYAAVRYPIVLIPGILGFEKILGVVEYFPAIPEALSSGGADVYIVYGSKANSSEVRAAQLIPRLEEIKAITGAERLNLVGHSQGAVDARIIAARRPDLVASITSVGGPHQGVPLAEKVDQGTFGPVPAKLLGALADLFTLLSNSTDPNDIDAAMHSLSVTGMAEINARYPAALPAEPCGQGTEIVNGIHYYSWGGVGNLTNPVDLLDPVWLLANIAAPGSNDGLIPRCSSHLGQVIRDDYMHNHIDETNMLFGLVMPLAARPQALFRQQANRLKLAGL